MTATATQTDYTMTAEQVKETLRQIGMGNILATSGGRYTITARGLDFPVRYGYAVRVRLETGLINGDTYTVQRMFKRGGKETVKGERTFIQWPQLSEAVYRAGCYHDDF